MVEAIEIGKIQITHYRTDLKKGSIGFTVTTSNSRIKNIIYYYDQSNFQVTLDKVKALRENYVERTGKAPK